MITSFFPNLTAQQQAQFIALQPLFLDWNSKINLISRKDTEHFVERHVLHSLSLVKVLPSLRKGARVMDLGSGGGFPGLPLAIYYPEVEWVLVDSVGKKIRAADHIAEDLGLKNVHCIQARAEELEEKFDFIVSRAVAPLSQLCQWTKARFKKQQQHALPNGLFALKGLEPIAEEVKALNRGNYTETWPLKTWFPEQSFFETKGIVYVQA